MPVPPWEYAIYRPVSASKLDRARVVLEQGRQFTRPWAAAQEVAAERMAVYAYPLLCVDGDGAALSGVVCRVWRRGEEDRPGYAFGDAWLSAAARRRAAA